MTTAAIETDCVNVWFCETAQIYCIRYKSTLYTYTSYLEAKELVESIMANQVVCAIAKRNVTSLKSLKPGKSMH